MHNKVMCIFMAYIVYIIVPYVAGFECVEIPHTMVVGVIHFVGQNEEALKN